MLHSFHKRNKAKFSGIIKYASLSKTSVVDEFQKLRAEAASHFLMIDIDLDSDTGGHEETRGRKIEPVGKIKNPIDIEDYDNELGWTLTKPKDNDYKGILLSSETPSIPEAANMFAHSDFVIDDFELNSPHAWRRRF